ncbi:MAG: glycosyltransferase family 4 protein [Acidobacteriaceae bacterium]
MASDTPRKVLITGGREVGGLNSFAEALADGFEQLGIPAEVIPPARIWSRWRDLRDPGVLKILSTSAIFAVPFAEHAICVTHGCPTAAFLGWKRFVGHICADRLAILSPQARFITVSHYSAVHLEAILALKVDAVIPNPIRSLFLEPFDPDDAHRKYITFAGRLHSTKNLPLLLPPIIETLDREPELEALIVGDGPQRQMLENLAARHPRVHFTGSLDAVQLRNKLRQTKVFISGCTHEALGIAYLEALSQGCNVAMPACGGGLEIAPHRIGFQIHLLPIALDHEGVVAGLRRALSSPLGLPSAADYSGASIAKAYLKIGVEHSIPVHGCISEGLDVKERTGARP